jgi:topoisomerase IA-like protein
MAVSLHKDYADYMKFIQEGKGEWGNYIERSGSFIVSLKSDTVLRNLAFAQLSELFKSEQGLGKK